MQIESQVGADVNAWLKNLDFILWVFRGKYGSFENRWSDKINIQRSDPPLGNGGEKLNTGISEESGERSNEEKKVCFLFFLMKLLLKKCLTIAPQ